MTTESSSSSVRYETLADYLRVLRRYWIMIVVVALIGAAAGLVYAKKQSPTYKATAEVGFQDPLQQLGVVGLAANTPQTSAQLAAVAADLVTAPSVVNQVKHQLKTSSSSAALSRAISAQVANPSGLLEVSATGSTRQFAANLANTTAQVLVAQDNAQARSQFAHLAGVVQRRISALAEHRGGTPQTNSELGFYQDELGRLQTMSSYAKTATFDRSAGTPASSATSTTRGIVLGLLFGLLLGILVAFIRDVTDRRLRGGKALHAHVGLPVLGRVRDRAVGRAVLISNSSRSNDQVDVEAFRIVRRNLELLDPRKPPRITLVTSAVADEGKTTVAASLAAAIASAGRRTLLIEADLRRPALATRLGVQQTPGLTDYLGGRAAPQEVLRTIEFSEIELPDDGPASANGHGGVALYRIVLVPSGSRTSRSAELVGSAEFRELIQDVGETYDAVVLDAAPLLSVSDTLEMLPHVDAVVLCVRESQTTRDQAAAAKSALTRFPGARVGVVVTGIKPRGAGDDAVYAHAYEYA